MPTTAVDLDRVKQIESAMMSTWPALTTLHDRSWVVRMAGGYTGRANSLTVLDPEDGADAARRLDWAEGVFRHHGLRPTVRISPLTPPELVSLAQERGYAPTADADCADILDGPLPDLKGGALDVTIEVPETPTDEWLDACVGVTNRADASRETLARMMAVMGGSARFLLARDGQTVLGVALAALHRTDLTFHAIATSKAARRRGVARAILAAGVRFGRAENASRLWVSVVASNGPARALYEGFGLSHVASYANHRLEA